MKPQLKRTVLTIADVLIYFENNPESAKYYCNLHTDYVWQNDKGEWNQQPPSRDQLTMAARWFVDNTFGVDGRIATSAECDAIADESIRLI